jgi:hypothetical protein
MRLNKKQRFSQNELLPPIALVKSIQSEQFIIFVKNAHTGISILFLGVLK